MNNSVNSHLAKAIADIAIFLEFTSENLLNPDASMEAMEQLAAELQLMNDADRESLTKELKRLSVEYVDKSKAKFVDSLPESLGLD
jgi:hypothetical protein